MIRRACIEDIHAMADLYYSYIGDSFISQFGKDFLREFLEGVSFSEQSVSYVLEINKDIAGFIIGAMDTSKLIKSLLYRKWAQLARHGLKMIIKNPRFIKNIIDSFIYSEKTKIKNVKAELLFIAVGKTYRKKGFGKELTCKALSEIKKRRIDKVKVSTLKDNKIVNEMLKTCGVRLEREFRFYGKDMILYTFK